MAATDNLLTVPQVAEYLNVSPWTLYNWRSRGTGPRSVKIGGAVRYRRSDVDAWLERQSDDRPGDAA